MNTKRHLIIGWTVLWTTFALIYANSAVSNIRAGQIAPRFTLSDSNGRSFALDEINGRQMTVLYFFDAGSDASQGGLLILDRLLRKYSDKQLVVWGITRSNTQAVAQFNKKAKLQFSILLDTAYVSKKYGAGPILPVVCTIGPGLEVLDYFQGGGETIEVMLTRLAERQIHRDQTQLAKEMAASVVDINPGNAEAKAVQGYAALAQGKTDEAKQVFDQIAAASRDTAILGQEGQAAVLARQGQSDKALTLAEEITQKAPQRAIAHKIKGDLLVRKGDRTAAAAAYMAAVKQSATTPLHKAEIYNQLGRLYSQEGKYSQARSLFDQAVDIDPYFIEPTSNKGVAYEKEGMWSKALAEYRHALALNQADTVAAVLARKAQQMLALQQDTARKERMDKLVNDLVARYKNKTKAATRKSEDEWTSRPMIISFIDIQEKGGLSPRDGLSIALVARLGELLNASGRVQVVERAIMEQLLSELNLGSSQLADPQTALELGKLLAAKLIGTGSLLLLPDSTMLSLRMIDTETSAVAKTITQRIAGATDLDRELFDLNREILKTVITKYPLQGYIVKTDENEVMLNLGSHQGVITGTTFEALDAGQTVTYKGRVLSGAEKAVARLEVVRVEPDFCYARIVEKQRALARDDKVKEILASVVVENK